MKTLQILYFPHSLSTVITNTLTKNCKKQECTITAGDSTCPILANGTAWIN